MRKLLRASLLAAAAALALTAHANAAAQMLCSGEVTVGTLARSIGGVNSSVPSKAIYQLNGQGCALIQQADIGYFLSQGFSPGADHNVITYTTGVATGTTNFVIGTLPAGAYIQKIVWVNSVAASAGNLSLGSTAGGTDIVSAVACGSSCINGDMTIAKTTFSASAATTLNLSSSAWNSTNVTITVVYGYF